VLAQFYAIKDGSVIGWCDILPNRFEGENHYNGKVSLGKNHLLGRTL